MEDKAKKYRLLKDDFRYMDVGGRKRKVYHIVYDRYVTNPSKDRYQVKPGDLGGWIENESCLSHDGECMILGDSVVCGYSRVSDNGLVVDSTVVDSRVNGDSMVIDRSVLSGNSETRMKAYISNSKLDRSRVTDDVIVMNGSDVKSCWFAYNLVVDNSKIDSRIYMSAINMYVYHGQLMNMHDYDQITYEEAMKRGRR